MASSRQGALSTSTLSGTDNQILDETSESAKSAEYDEFIKQQAEEVAKEDAIALEEARRDNDRKTRDIAFKDALRMIEGITTKAAEFSSRMLEHEDTKFSDEELRIKEQPGLFSGGTLRDYQLHGFQWLVRRAFMGDGVILADEMGLGKTIQVLAYVAWTREYLNGPTLIICPLSTLGNWMDEIHRFTPEVQAVRYHGSTEERENLRSRYIPKLARLRNDVDMPLFVTTYDVAVKDVEQLKGVLWRCLIIDEGHKLKNEKGVMRRMLREYSRSSTQSASIQVKILLTGTPVQNDMLELWSLCNFIMPSVFSDRDQFKKIYSFMGLGTTVGSDYLRSQEQQHAIISKLHAVLERYMLRRTKAEVRLALPPKVEVLVYTPLTREQIRLLRALDKGDISRTLRDMGWRDVKCLDKSSGVTVSTNNMQMNLRKVCCHPYEFAEPVVGAEVGRGPSSFDRDTSAGRGLGVGSGQVLGLATTQTDDRIITTCGKMLVLDKMLRRLRADGHRVLIFSQFTSMLDILADYFSFVGEGVLGEHRLLTGSTSAADRDAVIREFNGDKHNKIFAFLLSTKAGGLGINLVSADTVIFYDSDWNPKQDDQAQDRAHRIGQVRPVVVYRLVTEGASIERRMLRVAAGKGALGRMVLREGRYLLEDAQRPGHVAAESPASAGKRKRSSKGQAPVATDCKVDDNESNDVCELGGNGENVAAGFIDDSTGVSKYGKVDDRLLTYWLRLDGVGAEGPAAGAGPSSSTPSDGTLPIQIMRGIQDVELDAILCRARAMQAGNRVANTVESQLRNIGGQVSADTVTSSPLASSSPQKETEGKIHSQNESSARYAVMGLAKAAQEVVNALPAVFSSSSLPSASSISLPPSTTAEIAEEMAKWEAMASSAPSTPSKGFGYEFVYHEAARGLLPAAGFGTESTVAGSALAAVRAEIAEMARGAAAAAAMDQSRVLVKRPAKLLRQAASVDVNKAEDAPTARRSSRLHLGL